MRISDWSSDVCSSDLGGGRQAERQQRHQHAGGGGVVRRFRPGHALDRALAELLLPLGKPLFQPVGKEGGYFRAAGGRSEEHTSELQSLMRISYAVFCLNKKTYTLIILNKKHLHTK